MEDKYVREIAENIKRAAEKLKGHLIKYNPVINPEKNGIQEANLSLHFAHQCMSRDWYVFPEASNFTCCNNGNARVDLHVIVDNKYILTVEAKKLHNTTTGASLVEDFWRATTIEYKHDYNHLPHYVVLLAVTEKNDNVNWWCQSHNWINEHSTWKELAEVLERKGIVRSMEVMNDGNRNHYFLYAIEKIRVGSDETH